MPEAPEDVARLVEDPGGHTAMELADDDLDDGSCASILAAAGLMRSAWSKASRYNSLDCKRHIDDVDRRRISLRTPMGGAPFLHCTPTWGHALLRETEPAHPALKTLPSPGSLHFWVSWPTKAMPLLRADHPSSLLVVRCAGREVARVETQRPPHTWDGPLILTVDQADSSSWLIAEFRCGHTVRHMHVNPLLDSGECMSLEGLILLRSHPSATNGPHPMLFPGVAPERGFGIEMELLTELPRAAGQQHNLDELWGKVLAECGDADARERCSRWQWTHDASLQGIPSTLVPRMIRTFEGRQREAGSHTPLLGAEIERLQQLLTMTGDGAHQSEFKSPRPPHELRFARDAEAQLRGVVRVLNSLPAVAATPVGANGLSGTSLHVHVNVCDPCAAGVALTPRQILAVWIAWVRFDLVTALFARPWMRRSPSCAPLFATGPEIASGPSHAAPAAWEVDDKADVNAADVPAFLARLKLHLSSDGFEELPRSEQLRRLFSQSEGSASGPLGRYCSLNLTSVCKYGTVEIRRFHGTLNPTTLCCWSAFCVGFVECFHACTAETDAILDAPLAQGLAAINRAQESATLQQLRDLMSAHVGAATFEHLVRVSGTFTD